MAAVQQDGTALEFAKNVSNDTIIACAAVRNNHASLDKNDAFIDCMIENKVPPVERPELKTHMMERLQFKRIAEKSLPHPISKESTKYLGGKTRGKRIRKRTRKI